MRFMFVRFMLCTVLAVPGFAQDQTLRDSVPSIDVVRNRLQLTPEQEARLRPLFLQREQQLYETRTKLEIAASSGDASVARAFSSSAAGAGDRLARRTSSRIRLTMACRR